jgi:hypothetical protein
VQVDVVLAVEQRIYRARVEEELRICSSFGPSGLQVSDRSPLPSIASVNRTMLNTMSSFSFRAHARMFSASSRFCEKIVVEMPKLKLTFFCSSASRGWSRSPC